MGNSSSSSAGLIEAVHVLRTNEVPDVGEQGEEQYWNQLIPTTAVPTLEIFSAIHPETVREIIATYPRNIALVVLKSVEILHDPAIEQLGRLSNAIRLLTRLIPVIFESGENSEFCQKFFWENQIPTKRTTNKTETSASSSPSSETPPSPPPPAAEWEQIPTTDPTLPLGTAIVHATMHTLFLGEFTASTEQVYAFSTKLSASRVRQEAREARRAAAERGEVIPSTGAGDDDENDIIPDETNAVWPSLLWKAGVGFPELTPFTPSAAQLTNRADVLRLLIALCSQPLFATPVPQSPARSRFLDEATAPTCPFAPTLFYCLLNTILEYDPIGMGVPFASAVVSDTDAPLVAISLQALLLLLDYAPLQLPEDAEEDEAEQQQEQQTTTAAAAAAGQEQQQQQQQQAPGEDENKKETTEKATEKATTEENESSAAGAGAGSATTTSTTTQVTKAPASSITEQQQQQPRFAQFNIYRSLSASYLAKESDFAMLFDGIARILSAGPSAEQSLIPGAYQVPSFTQEILVLLWKLLDENTGFLNFVLSQCDITAIVGPILYLMWGGRNNITKIGLIHLCTFTLLLMSGERAFGVGLNRAFTSKPPPEFPLLEGSYADVLMIVLHKLVVDGSTKLSSLYSCFLTIISNSSPYAKSLSLATSMRLVNLFDLFSAPRFLFARPANFGFVSQLLETLNNLIQYQYESNSVLVYSIIRRREVFEKLMSQSVSAYQRAVEARTAMKKNGITAGGSNKGKSGAAAAATTTTNDNNNDSEANKKWAESRNAAAGSSPAAISPSSNASSSSGNNTSGASSSAVWKASDEWFEGVRRQLPMAPVSRLIEYLAPLIEEYVERAGGVVDDEAVITFLKSSTVVGVLPVPHPIVMRKYQPNEFTSLWFTTFLWSTVFLHLCKEVPMFDAEAIKLFSITVV